MRLLVGQVDVGEVIGSELDNSTQIIGIVQ